MAVSGSSRRFLLSNKKLYLCRDPFNNNVGHLELQSEPVSGKIKHFSGRYLMVCNCPLGETLETF